MKVADILRKALELLGPNGENWQKQPDAEHLCAVLAIGAASGGYGRNKEAFKALKRATGGRLIALWNDDPARTWPEIKAAFKQAIEEMEKLG